MHNLAGGQSSGSPQGKSGVTLDEIEALRRSDDPADRQRAIALATEYLGLDTDYIDLGVNYNPNGSSSTFDEVVNGVYIGYAEFSSKATVGDFLGSIWHEVSHAYQYNFHGGRANFNVVNHVAIYEGELAREAVFGGFSDFNRRSLMGQVTDQRGFAQQSHPDLLRQYDSGNYGINGQGYVAPINR